MFKKFSDKIKNVYGKPKRLLIVAAVFLCALFSLIGAFYRPLPREVMTYAASTRAYDSVGGLMYAELSANEEWCIPVSLDRMGRWTPVVAVGIEDKRFYDHGGVDIWALGRAVRQNLKAGRVTSGASTITTQVIRIAIPRPRTLLTKLAEFWRAWQLEGKASKDEILEMYLNRAPFGGNLRGVEAASLAYFNKSAAALSLGESAVLIGTLRAPSRFRPDRYPTRAKNMRDRILAQLEANAVISAESHAKAVLEPVKPTRYSMPGRAPLAARRAMREAAEGTAVRTTINPSMQLMLERNLEHALSSLPEEITASAIIVDNATRNATAYVGNARYGSGLAGSEVDCADAPRSPGSTLKPFVYAASFAAGKRTPATLVADTPVAFAGNAPRNYDRAYRGPVSTRLALALSLNAPAVRVLREVGYEAMLGLYENLGFSYINKAADFYADSLVLGGCEVTLSQLAAGYAALADGGKFKPLRWTKAARAPERQVFSPEAAFLTMDVLLDERRLVPLYREIFGQEGVSVAFKTGTSYGSRDAWTVGATKSTTVAVWFGDPSGKSHDELIGLDLAAPTLLRVFRELKNTRNESFPIPENIYTREVCALSGALPTMICPHIREDYAIKEISDQKLCRIHRQHDGRITIVWPEELKQWAQMRDTTEQDPTTETEARIIRPADGSKFFLPQGEDKIRLFISAEAEGEHFWYLDGKFIDRSKPGESRFIDVTPGLHELTLLANEQSDAVSFVVISPVENDPPEITEPEILNNFGN